MRLNDDLCSLRTPLGTRGDTVKNVMGRGFELVTFMASGRLRSRLRARARSRENRLFRSKTGDFGPHTDHSYPLHPSKTHKKFMLMDSSVGPFIRVGGPFHRDIVAATIRELVECGRVKAAASLTQRGGGWLTNLGDEIALNGASTDFGPPDYNVVQRILSQELPSVKVSVLE